MLLSIIIPAYNESKIILSTLKKVRDWFEGQDFEIVVVDDGSTDNTVQLIKASEIPVQLVRMERNSGKGAAVQRGVKHAKGDLILISDADLSICMDHYNKLLSHLSPEYPIVIGSKGLRESDVKTGFLRVKLGRVGNRPIQFLVPGIQDSQCGFKLFYSNVGKELLSKQRLTGFGYDFEILFLARKLNYKIKEVSVTCIRSERESKVKIHHYFTTLLDLVKVYYSYKRGLYNISKLKHSFDLDALEELKSKNTYIQAAEVAVD